MSWSSVVAPPRKQAGSNSREEAARDKDNGRAVVVDNVVDRRRAGDEQQARRASAGVQRRRGRGGRNSSVSNSPSSRKAKGIQADPKLKAPTVFSAPPPNAWGLAAETKERLGVPAIARKDHDEHCRKDVGDTHVVSCEQEQCERPVLPEGTTTGDSSEPGPSAVVDAATARACFRSLAHGLDSLHESVSIEPVGMENPGNVCFANSVIQALLGCDSFRSILHRIAMAGDVLDTFADDYPVLKAMADIGRELIFKPLDGESTRPCEDSVRRGSAGASGVSKASSTAGPRFSGPHNSSRRPRAINVALITRLVHESFSTRYKGEQRTRQIEQEDAHEFMHCLLDGMHQELLKIGDDPGWVDSDGASGAGASFTSRMGGLQIEDSTDSKSGVTGVEDDEGEWLTQSGKRAVKQKVVTTDIVTAARRKTAITELFEGMQATSISSRGNPPSVTMHPFLVVEIPLYDPSIDTLEAAISNVMATETISGYRPAGGTGAACEASKSERFQSLPDVLMLHMMRFQFTGSSEKLNKTVRYGANLRVRASWMMAGCSAKDRRAEYQLVATISHHGDSISRGHFTANVRHDSDDPTGIDSDWVNLNDEIVRPIREDRVLHDTPYMLFYRRMK